MILFVDDDDDNLTRSNITALQNAGLEVCFEPSPGRAVARMKAGERFTFLITDLMMTPDGDLDARRSDQGTRTGLLVLERFRAACPGRPVIVLTVVPDQGIQDRVRPPLERYLRKRDAMPSALVRHVRELLQAGG